MTAEKSDQRIRLGVSACLLGDEVRYDGGHKRNALLVGLFGPFVEWVKVCPEVESGMGTPRESMRLVADDGRIRMVTMKSGVDHTPAMARYASRRVNELAHDDLWGYVLKKDSPSCGMARVKVYGRNGPPARTGTGLFAEALRARLPDLPVEEEGRLVDSGIRENFVERIFAYGRLLNLFGARWTPGDLVRFHTAHKLVLMAHSLPAYTELGRLVAMAGGVPRVAMRQKYSSAFMAALTIPTTRPRHTNVLQHILGYFKRTLDPDSRSELVTLIESYRQGRQPLVAPVTLIRHHVRRLGLSYLAGQVYLDPGPPESLLQTLR